MAVKYVIKGMHVVPMGLASAFLIEGDDGLTLIEGGFPRSMRSPVIVTGPITATMSRIKSEAAVCSPVFVLMEDRQFNRRVASVQTFGVY